jgi:hypothetical protein
VFFDPAVEVLPIIDPVYVIEPTQLDNIFTNIATKTADGDTIEALGILQDNISDFDLDETIIALNIVEPAGVVTGLTYKYNITDILSALKDNIYETEAQESIQSIIDDADTNFGAGATINLNKIRFVE